MTIKVLELVETDAGLFWETVDRPVDFIAPIESVKSNVTLYRMATQNLIDTKAQERQYDSGATLASYVNSTVPEWSIEAQAFVAWRDQVWMHAMTELAKVEQGERDIPTVEDFIAELPAFEWPELKGEDDE